MDCFPRETVDDCFPGNSPSRDALSTNHVARLLMNIHE